MPLESISDESILTQVASGDNKALGLLIERFGSLVWSIAKRYVRPEHFIEDVAQEIFTEIWKKAGQFDSSKSSAKTFIALVTRRRCIDWLRKKSKEPIVETDGDYINEVIHNEDTVHIQNETLIQALRLLSDGEQELFQLHFQQGMTHSEISDKSGVPLGTVKTQLRRGLIKLRQKLQELQ